jgi:hypothetical protein
MPFMSGISGNPSGRPKGIVDRRMKLRLLLEDRAEEIVNLAMERAASGSDSVLVALINRLLPNLRPENLLELNIASQDRPLQVRWMTSSDETVSVEPANTSAATG